MANRGVKTQIPVYGSSMNELACAKFINDYKDATYERGQAQLFCADFLSLFGISREEIISGEALEHRIKHYNQDKHKNEQCFIDAFIKNKIIIEMKSANVKLDAAEEQIRKYYDDLPKDERPRLRMICDFKTIILRDMVADIRYKEFPVKELFNHAYKFNCLSNMETPVVHRDQEKLSTEASEKMASVYRAFKSIGFDGSDLMKMLVRLLFCMYAEDTDVFPQLSFTTLIMDSKEDGSDLKYILTDLFSVLNKPLNERKLIKPEYAKFPYVNGGLFKDIGEIPPFDNCFFKTQLKIDKGSGKTINPIRQALYDCCWFDWHGISPAIFGAMFQKVMSPKERREGGVHFTSYKNIEKVIRPLFLNQLEKEWLDIEMSQDVQEYEAFQNKLASLKFLDPACGCGNFLMVAYQEIRRLENKVIKAIVSKQRKFNLADVVCKVDIDQFYGIEILEFPCEVARVSMWLVKHMMNVELQKELTDLYITPFLPLQNHANIYNANALLVDWESLIQKSDADIQILSMHKTDLNKKKLNAISDKYHFDYIFGNPPFLGGMIMNREQKLELVNLFENSVKGIGECDYVCGWYVKICELLQLNKKLKASLVSTNSITQGEQTAILWKYLFNKYGIQIDFAYRTFKWYNEASGKAQVHCVIIGFSKFYNTDKQNADKQIYTEDGKIISATNINGYLADAPNIFITSRRIPLCESPRMCFGNMPRDGGGFILNEQEKNDFINKEPITKKWIHPYIGANEYIKGKSRYCLWLKDANLDEIQNSNLVKERLYRVKKARLASTAEDTRSLANTPTLFAQITQPIDKDFIIIPRVSSESRGYIPIGFLPSGVVASDATQVIPEATLYHFGILTSSVHMAWMRAVCGRLEMRYRYSKEIVYNNFPWPIVSDVQKAKIEKTAQLILDARNLHHECSMKSLYGITMPPDLYKAHEANDHAVMDAYGFKHDMTEPEIVAELFTMYKKLVDAEKSNKHVKKTRTRNKKKSIETE